MRLINSEFTVNSIQLMPEQNISNTYVFPIRQFTAFMHVGTEDNTSAWCLRIILNSESPMKSTKMPKSSTKYNTLPLSKGQTFQDPSGCLKSPIVLSPTYSTFFPTHAFP